MGDSRGYLRPLEVCSWILRSARGNRGLLGLLRSAGAYRGLLGFNKGLLGSAGFCGVCRGIEESSWV